MRLVCLFLRRRVRDFPGGPIVKTAPSNAGGAGSIPAIPGRGAKIPHAWQPKNQNINNKSNIVTNSIKTLKMVHVKKRSLKKGQPPCLQLSVRHYSRFLSYICSFNLHNSPAKGAIKITILKMKMLRFKIALPVNAGTVFKLGCRLLGL